MKKIRERCPKCKNIADLTKDHIIPQHLLTFVERFDFPEIYHNWREIIYSTENYEWICKPCNKLKSHKFDFSDERTIKLLQKITIPKEVIKKEIKPWLK